MPTDPATETFEFDVALSYAGQDRVYVHSVAEQLRARDVRLFYDEFFRTELWGADLYDLFDDIFRKRARFAVIFVSHHYANRPWPTYERQSSQARALLQAEPYLLPVRLDDTDLPGLRPTIGYVDARHLTSDQLVDLIVEKLGKPGRAEPATPRPIRVPRTAEQMRELLGQRPRGWEYLLFAGVLYQSEESLGPKWQDYRLHYVRPTGPLFSSAEALTFIQSAMNDVVTYLSNAVPLFDPHVQSAAFGSEAEGIPGDSKQIEYLARRLVGIYEDLLDLAAGIRGARCPQGFRRLFELTVAFTEQPISQLRECFHHFIADADQISEWVANPSLMPAAMELNLTLTIDKRLAKEYDRELNRLMRHRFL